MGTCSSTSSSEPSRVGCWNSSKSRRTTPQKSQLRVGKSGQTHAEFHGSSGPACNGSFEGTPPEVLLEIFARCPVQSYPTLRRVCRTWRRQLAAADELKTVRESTRTSEQWVVIASVEGDREPCSLKIRAFHCQSKRWRTLGVPKHLAAIGSGFAVSTVGHRLYLTGGTMGRHGHPTSATWCYDLFLNSWEKKAAMVTARRRHAMGSLCGKLVVAGGEISGPDDLCLSEIYDPETDTWHEIPDSALPAQAQEGWVVNSCFYIRHLPDRVYKLIVPDSDSTVSSSVSCTEAEEIGGVLEPEWLNGVQFQVAPYRKQADPVLAGMDFVTSAEGRVYGCMLSSHLSSIGVFNKQSRAWHLLIGNGMTFHRIFERFDGLVCGGGCLFIVTRDNALVQVVMEDRGSGLAGPEWLLLSRGDKHVRHRWRKFGCLEL